MLIHFGLLAADGKARGQFQQPEHCVVFWNICVENIVARVLVVKTQIKDGRAVNILCFKETFQTSNHGANAYTSLQVHERGGSWEERSLFTHFRKTETSPTVP